MFLNMRKKNVIFGKFDTAHYKFEKEKKEHEMIEVQDTLLYQKPFNLAGLCSD